MGSEVPIGKSTGQDGMGIGAVYLQAVTMAPMPAGMQAAAATGKKVAY